MRTHHHPLFSPLALNSTVLLLAGLGVALYLTGGRAFLPSDLSAVAHSPNTGAFDHHAAFADDCTACHAPMEGVTDDRCLTCHTEIAAQQQVGENLHGRLVQTACVDCHDEHNGQEVDLVARALGDFSAENHALLFPLTGAHLTLQCTDCHQNGQYADTATTCAGCHAEPAAHAGLFGTDCASCHTTDAWQTAALTAHTFPLDHGGMGELSCATCHVETLTAYSCATCHAPSLMATVHEGMGAVDDCISCHQVATSAETEALNR